MVARSSTAERTVTRATKSRTRKAKPKPGRVPVDAVIAKDIAKILTKNSNTGKSSKIKGAVARLKDNCWTNMIEASEVVAKLYTDLKKAIDKNKYSEVGKLQLRLASKINLLSHNTTRASGQINALAFLQDLVDESFPLEQVAKDVLSLKKEHTKVEYDGSTKTLIVTTKPIQINCDKVHPPKMVDLGEMEIYIPLLHPYEYSVKAVTPNLRDNYYHPHVMTDGSLCIGDGDEPYRNALEIVDIFGAVSVITAVLRTYNGESPYKTLDSWALPPQFGCSSCGDRHGVDDKIECPNPQCKRAVGKHCTGICHYKDCKAGQGCGSCMYHCMQHKGSSKTRMCWSHLKGCSNCGGTCCLDHLVMCDFCKRMACKADDTSPKGNHSCVTACPNCNKNLCRYCRAYQCNKCKKYPCTSCFNHQKGQCNGCVG